jgi:type III pantothenate kinase
MLLLVDCGNTRVKWALANDLAGLGAWSDSGAVTHAQLGELPARWHGVAIRRAIAVNVAGPDVEETLRRLLPADTAWFRSQAELKGMHNRYRDPAQLGADRFAAALGARARAPGKRLVVATCGTATTIDAVDAQGDFLGGMIMPGVELMAASLARNTAQRPMVAAGTASGAAAFADNTDDAIRSGILAAQAGAIERACALHRAELCILSGGAAAWVAPALAVPCRMVDNIVLVGLHAAAT